MIMLQCVSRAPQCQRYQLNNARRWAICLLSAVFAALLMGVPTFAQLNYGRIFGAVTDQSGGSLVGATVTVTDLDRGVSRALTADAAGEYSAPSLIPGTYTVRAEFKGFKVVERAGIAVGVGQDIRVDLSLQPGDQTQTVTVTGEAPQVNTTNAQLGGTIENQAVADLPVSGRTYTGLLSYKPGLVARPGVTANAYMSNGGRPQGTVWMLDGLYDVNAYHGATGNLGGQGGASVELSNFLPIDAIQEVNVIENPKAEYGWKPGAQVNVGLKSGTNDIHGSAVGFGSDAALDAKNPFLAANQPKATATLEQFGGTIGGPIKKDKLFYFASYEGQRYTVGAPHVFQEPTTTPNLGPSGVSISFPDAIADLKNHGITPSTLSLNLAGCTAAGVCNVANGLFQNAGNSINVTASPNSFGTVDNGVGKIDYHINEHNSVNGEYYIGDGKFVAPFAGATEFPQEYWATGASNLTEVVRGIWDWIPNSSWVNEARFGLDHVYSSLFADDCNPGTLGAPDYSKLGFVSGAPDCGFPQVTINGFTNLGGYKSDQPITFNTWAFSDSVSYTRGKHLFKFGAEFHITTLNGGQFTFGKGGITFGGPQVTGFTGETPLEFFLAGTPSSGNLLLGNPLRNIRLQQYAGFIQDDWRVTPRLTLNLGFRYEAVPPVTEANNLFGNFDPTSPTGLIQQSGGHPVYNGAYDNFEPRFGLAWDVTGKGTTVVRAGAGVTYGVYPLLDLIGSTQGATLNNIPTGFKLVAANGSVIPSPGTQQTGSLSLLPAQMQWIAGQPIFNSSGASLACGNGIKPNPASCGINVIDKNFKLTRVFTWSFGVQHAFNNNLSMDISYVGNHGNQSGIIDANAATPGPTGASGTNPLTNEQLRRPYYNQFPYLSTIQYLTNNEYSNYNSLQASLTQRVSHGLYFTVGYTYSHALDMGSDELMDQLLMDARHPQLDYGNAGFDVRHSLTVAWTYAIPGLKTPGQFLEGWQINSAMTFLSPFPWAAVDSTDDISGTGDLQDRWTLVGNPSDFKVGGLRTVPCFAGTLSSKFGKAGCTVGLPAACINAASAEPNGPVGSTGQPSTGIAQLNAIGCYMQGSSVIVPPAQGTFGTMSRDQLRSTIPFYNWDFSIFKSWKFKERWNAQFRAEFFNLINHPQYQDQGQGSGNTSSLGSPGSFGNAQAEAGAPSITGTGLPRRIQLGLKLTF